MIVCFSKVSRSLQWFTFNIYNQELYNKTGQYDFSDNFKNISKNLHQHKMRSCIYSHPPNSVVFNYNNGTIKAASVQGKAFYMMAELLNISKTLVEPVIDNMAAQESAIYYDNNSLCDVLFTSTFRPNKFKTMANIYPLFIEDNCVMMPKGTQIFGIQNFIMPFENTVWYYLFLSLCFAYVTQKSISVLDLPWRTNVDNQFTFLHVVGLIVNVGNHVKHNYLTYERRVFIFTICVFGFFLMNSYQTQLYKFLMEPKYYRNPQSLSDVGNSGLNIIIEKNTYKIFRAFPFYREYPKPFLDSILRKNGSEFLHLVETNNISFGYSLSKTRINFILQRLNERSPFYRAEECLLPYFLSYAVACDFPLTNKIEGLMLRLFEVGFYTNWESYVGREKISLNDTLFYDHHKYEDDSDYYLSRKNIDGILQMYMWSIVVCIIVFLVELVFYNRLSIN